jgi:hypothetical protein
MSRLPETSAGISRRVLFRATLRHRDRNTSAPRTFSTRLENRGADVLSLEQSAKLLFLDAEKTLRRFMVNGRPEWERFEKSISAAVRSLDDSAVGRVRAYGEMVGILWLWSVFGCDQAGRILEPNSRFVRGEPLLLLPD